MNQHLRKFFIVAFLICLLASVVRSQTQQPSWSLTGSLNTARTRHTATLLANGKVLVVGGLTVANPCCQTAGSAELYDPVTGRWAAISSPITSRYGHIAVRLMNGKVLIAGGTNDKFGLEASAEIYDPVLGIWSAASNLNVARDSAQATLLADGRVLITGGGALVSTGLADKAEVYNPLTNDWIFAGTMKKGRVLHSIALLPDGKVLVAGGLADSILRTSEIYDPATNTWTLTGELTIPSANRPITLLTSGKVLIAGGVNSSESPVNRTELYDPSTGQWNMTGSLTTPRALHSLTLLPNGKVLAVGGSPGGSTTLNTAELYDPVTEIWTPTAALGVARLSHTATLLPNGKVLVAGGRTLIGTTISSAELFDSRTPAIISVSAANFVAGQLAPESVVAAFGSNLAASTQVASGLPLPTELAGASIRVRDFAGVERAAPLFFVSPNQINYQIPAGTLTGTATVSVNSGSVGGGEIVSVSPGLFTADASGAGLAAATVLRVKANGDQVYEPVVLFDSETRRFIAVPIDPGNPAEQVYLLAFGTGFRYRSDLANVSAKIGDSPAEVLFAGAQGDFVGLDQCNIRLLPNLAGRGEVAVVLTVDGKATNTVRIAIR